MDLYSLRFAVVVLCLQITYKDYKTLCQFFISNSVPEKPEAFKAWAIIKACMELSETEGEPELISEEKFDAIFYSIDLLVKKYPNMPYIFGDESIARAEAIRWLSLEEREEIDSFVDTIFTHRAIRSLYTATVWMINS